MKSSAKPTIELYMYSLNQEFPVGKGHSSFLNSVTDRYVDKQGKVTAVKQVSSQILKRIGATDWSVQWISNEWIQNYTYYPGGALVEEGDPLLQIVLREEDFGAILFDRINDRIYKVNKPGLNLFTDIVTSHKEGKLAKFAASGFESSDVEAFTSFLKGAGLWPMK